MSKKNKEIWMTWIWPGFHWYQGINPMYAYQKDIPKFGYKFSKMAVTYSKATEAYYFIKNEYEENGAKFFRVVENNPKILFVILDKINKAAEEIFSIGKKWENVDFNKLSDERLIQNHKLLFKWDAPLWRNGQIPNLLELHNSYLSGKVKSIIKKAFPGKEQDSFRILTTSSYDSMTEKQDQDFLSLLHKDIKLVKKHWKKYTWMTFGWSGPELTYEYFLDNYKQARKHRRIEKKIKENIKAKKASLTQQKKLLSKLSVKDRWLVLLLRQILEAKARRVDAHSLTYFLAEKMMVEIGKRIGLSLNQMRVVIPANVPKLFRKIDVVKINEEYNRVLFWYEKSKLTKYSGKQAEERLKYIAKRLPKVKLVKQFKGEMAYPGKVRGTVRILLDIKDSQKFKPGEILVSRMTDPSYVPIMKMAKAILTDIGGITCHAAIVSRELRKPCLVGTLFATSVLKDGDLVEVDANKGVVRKI